MTESTRITRLTPSGTGAIASFAIDGPSAWSIIQRFFQPASGKPLPELPQLGQVWFGRLGTDAADEVVLSVRGEDTHLVFEIHTHGGIEVVRWVLELFTQAGCLEDTNSSLYRLVPKGMDARAWQVLPFAKTTRLASILLDQCHGAFRSAIQGCQSALQEGSSQEFETRLKHLMSYIPVGQHLVEPFHVTVVGAPNVGKSSLMNALAGFQRSVVTDIPGTTRDVVNLQIALDGWMIELNDTAGIRDSIDPIELEGIEKAKQATAASDLCLWILDSTARPIGPTPRLVESLGVLPDRIEFVINKIDLRSTWDVRELPQAIRVSATQGKGLNELSERMVERLIPKTPHRGEAVPFTRELCYLLKNLWDCWKNRDLEQTRTLLASMI